MAVRPDRLTCLEFALSVRRRRIERWEREEPLRRALREIREGRVVRALADGEPPPGIHPRRRGGGSG